MLGCGSGELLRAAVQAFTSPSRALVAPEPTFEAPGNLRSSSEVPSIAPPRGRQASTRSRCDGRRGAWHRSRLLLQSEQPNGHGSWQGRGRRAISIRWDASSPRDDRARRRGVPRIRRGSVIRHRDSDCADEPARRRDAHVLQSVRHGRPSRRLRDRSAGDAQEDVVVAPGLERQPARPRGGRGDGRTTPRTSRRSRNGIARRARSRASSSRAPATRCTRPRRTS